VPRDVASRNAKRSATKAAAWARPASASISISRRHRAPGQARHRERYGNLFDMYERITGEDPYQVPMRIYPAIHYTMGGLWVDYNLMSTIPGLYVIGEANFSDHGANRLGASALMQGLADGYFVLPYTIGDYLASQKFAKVDRHAAVRDAEAARADQRASCCRSRARARWIPSIASWARSCGNTAACRAPRRAEAGASARFPRLREQFWRDVKVLGAAKS
jgi:succinate dehydrogenase / fumarate reductase, flavoprotein subunit